MLGAVLLRLNHPDFLTARFLPSAPPFCFARIDDRRERLRFTGLQLRHEFAPSDFAIRALGTFLLTPHFDARRPVP